FKLLDRSGDVTARISSTNRLKVIGRRAVLYRGLLPAQGISTCRSCHGEFVKRANCVSGKTDCSVPFRTGIPEPRGNVLSLGIVTNGCMWGLTQQVFDSSLQLYGRVICYQRQILNCRLLLLERPRHISVDVAHAAYA